jgi:hypothetical protein
MITAMAKIAKIQDSPAGIDPPAVLIKHPPAEQKWGRA